MIDWGRSGQRDEFIIYLGISRVKRIQLRLEVHLVDAAE